LVLLPVGAREQLVLLLHLVAAKKLGGWSFLLVVARNLCLQVVACHINKIEKQYLDLFVP